MNISIIDLPIDLLIYIIKICLEDAMESTMIRHLYEISKSFNEILKKSDEFWKIVYNNYKAPYKYMMWNPQYTSYKELMKRRLDTCKKNKWFLRLKFIEFICNDKTVKISYDLNCTCAELLDKFSLYSGYSELPHTWDRISGLESEDKQKIIYLARCSKYVRCAGTNQYVGWNFPRDKSIIIYGLKVI